MKVKVTKTIVEQDKLDDAISVFQGIRLDQAAYLIMNTKTAEILNEQLCKEWFGEVINAPLGMYRDCKVLIDECLEFGEVDVR